MDRTKINILIGLAIIVLLIIFVAAKTHNKNNTIQTPKERAPFEQVEDSQVQDFSTPEKGQPIEFDPNDPNLPPPPVGVKKNQEPNALDVMAPGYRKAQERVKNVQKLRNQALEAQRQDLENIK